MKRWHPWIRRPLVLVIGGAILLVGLVMLFTPGPGLVVILIGLTVLASEFIWAHQILAHLRKRFAQAADKARQHLIRRGKSKS